MIKYIFTGALICAFITTSRIARAQNGHPWEEIGTDIYSKQTVSKKGFKLVLINKDTLFSKTTAQNIIDVFFKVYPQEVKRFYPGALRTVTIVITKEYDGVAATVGGIIKVNPGWLKKHPEDYDIITHELMHVVQSYSNDNLPGWLTEGIADYARYHYGVNNPKAGWTLPPYRSDQTYTNAYRITARFLVWLEINKRTDIVDQLNLAMRNGSYTPDTWKELTGQPVDALWLEYSNSPAIVNTAALPANP